MSLKNLLTVKEVAALLRVSTQTLYKMLEQGLKEYESRYGELRV